MTDGEKRLPRRPAGRRLHGWLIGTGIALLSAFALVTAYYFLEHYPHWLDWWPDVTIAQIEQYIRDSGKWGMAISVGLMVAHSFVPLPSEPIAMANGMVYGAATGSLLTWVGAMLGAQAAYWPARTVGRVAIVRHVAPERMARILRWVDTGGIVALLGLRLIPVISFNLINYVAGLANVSWWTFTWTTGIGILPFTLLFVVMGQNASSLSAGTWAAIAGAAILFILLVRHLQKRWAG